jgi:uncharacterized protein
MIDKNASALSRPIVHGVGLRRSMPASTHQGVAVAISMHSASVPVFERMLGNMNNWLDKAEAHAAAKKFEPSVYLGLRLAPDMLAFTTQIQIACDAAKFCMSRLSGVDAPKFEDNEVSLADLRARITKTIAYLRSVPADAINGTDAKDISVPRRAGAIVMKGENYLKQFALPNFFFHVTTVYALLRHSGVELGKADYLGALTAEG